MESKALLLICWFFIWLALCAALITFYFRIRGKADQLPEYSEEEIADLLKEKFPSELRFRGGAVGFIYGLFVILALSLIPVLYFFQGQLVAYQNGALYIIEGSDYMLLALLLPMIALPMIPFVYIYERFFESPELDRLDAYVYFKERSSPARAWRGVRLLLLAATVNLIILGPLLPTLFFNISYIKPDGIQVGQLFSYQEKNYSFDQIREASLYAKSEYSDGDYIDFRYICKLDDGREVDIWPSDINDPPWEPRKTLKRLKRLSEIDEIIKSKGIKANVKLVSKETLEEIQYKYSSDELKIIKHIFML